VPPIVITSLKLLFLALLYLFVYRTIRAVVVGLRAPAPAGTGEAPASGRRVDKPPRRLVVLDERGVKVNTLGLDGNLQIGRAEACQVRLDDTFVSAFHARIFRREDGWYVEDLGSTNGTFLNDRRVTSPVALAPGDRLKVGKSTMELRR
jgi:pSer/pThr/pTyr-binding forkhead associated (FHA) protein